MSKIIVHPGQAHEDDLISAALVCAMDTQVTSVERRDPTEAEIADPSVWVLDVGKKLDPVTSCFDHHQLARGTEECTISLVLKQFGKWESALACFKWLRATVLIDSCGPFQAAEKLGVTVAQLFSGRGPASEYMIEQFQNGKLSVEQLREYGNWFLDKMNQYETLMGVYNVNSEIVTVGGVKVVYMAYVKDVLFLNEWQAKNAPDAACCVTKDDRGDGLTLYRFNDHPAIDFSKLEGVDGILFAHKGGFLAKTKSVVERSKALELIGMSVKCG